LGVSFFVFAGGIDLGSENFCALNSLLGEGAAGKCSGRVGFDAHVGAPLHKPLPALPREGTEKIHYNKSGVMLWFLKWSKKRGPASAPGRVLPLWAKAGIALA